ncbi:MAG: thioredoxin domain-containing protein, partial [Rhodobacteraceae bacterium]|nr:thioredoxin domain-containing protein [Paracoccaceae bacterium]
RQAWDVSLGLFALADGDARKFYDFATYVYERQDQFYNGPFLHKTHDDLRQFVADLAQGHSDVDRETFLKRMADNDIYVDARTPIRYAATKGVWATPTFFVNNSDNVPVDHSSTLDNWKELIDPLLSL